MVLSYNNFPILLALLSFFCMANMDVGLGQGREQAIFAHPCAHCLCTSCTADAEAFQQELHKAAIRSLLRLEYERHCCALSGKLLLDNSYAVLTVLRNMLH